MRNVRIARMVRAELNVVVVLCCVVVLLCCVVLLSRTLHVTTFGHLALRMLRRAKCCTRPGVASTLNLRPKRP